MKAKTSMSIKELAELLGVSTDTVRRAARSGLIPSTREGTAYRFDFKKVRQAMERRANEMRTRRSMQASAPGGRGRPRAAQPPPLGNTGAWLTRE
ncbi:helix-turn-helix domain-containing protein [Petrachloros mirabilis]